MVGIIETTANVILKAVIQALGRPNVLLGQQNPIPNISDKPTKLVQSAEVQSFFLNLKMVGEVFLITSVVLGSGTDA